jgi:hypothetical protein
MRSWLPGQRLCSRLPSASSIFSAEANAILLALKFVASSDSLSCLLAIECCKSQNPFILKIAEIYKSLVAIGKHVLFTWKENQKRQRTSKQEVLH